MRKFRVVPACAIAVACLMSAPAAFADGNWTPTDNPGVTVWQHGGSNMGECSAYLSTVLGVRDDVNHLIQAGVAGPVSPGDVFSNRARQQVNLDPVQECLQHTGT